ncbi:molecular chaperone HtpG [Natranaerovirga hydrolytica]|uniref:Molecular chaperone HtpG n=1 Tax=Natranaerovirga hydrolytica TaxID=680378 RepID=A0A4V2PZP3_9FIRM|nr:molecular chaperone HtpG [Natranaerovirga hydrolytica]TCK90621.1 molecular chaperone HtpG [Natranaerovirga hydrolytica]
MNESGSLSIHSENIFPIIKKWLYSDHDIFVRELISNACDAITKLKKLDVMSEYTLPENTTFKVDVVLNEKDKTIKIIDNGIGMTAEEIKKYINQIAFSGAEDFLDKYKDKANQEQIIGHFGLGFYSAFMVAETVTIDTLSYEDGAAPALWECDGGTEFSLTEGSRTQRGTTITLHIGDDGKDFLNAYTLRTTIEKYCSFMPYDIFFIEEGKEEAKKEDASEEKEEQEEIKPLNDTNPLWLKHPNDCSEEDYKAFYKKVFMDFKEPLFWIHLNMDYPFNLKGILYFPKINNEFESMEGQIKLFNNQVFVADNIKEVIPEFLLLLKGVIDCPDLPLNVSRSFLQNDGFVKKISDYITKKVADKLTGLYKTENDNFKKFWGDIHPFVKFGSLKDNKFYDKVKDIIIYKSIYGEYVSLKDYMEKNKEKNKDKVFYVSDEQQQSQYIDLFKQYEMDAIVLDHSIDQAFMSHMEAQEQDVKFQRIDSDLSDHLKEASSEEDLKPATETLEKLFKDVLNNDTLKVKVESLKTEDLSSIMLLSEESRRMQEMSKMYGLGDLGANMPSDETLVLNNKNQLVQYLLTNNEDETKVDDIKMICEQLYDLALLSHKPLPPESMTKFIKRSNQLLSKLAL